MSQPRRGNTSTGTNSSGKHWDATILKEDTQRDEFLVKWKGKDENQNDWPDSWVPRSDCSKGLLMAWEKDVNNPRNRALKSNGVLSPVSSLHSRTLSWEGVLPGKRRASELGSDSEQAFATKKRRRSPKPPIDDLSYEPSQSIPSQLHHRVQPVRVVSPAKPKTKDVKRRIVSDNESDSLNSISRRSSAPTVGSGAHDGPGYKRATARRSGLATRRLSSALSDGESGQFPDGKAENTTSGNESEQPKRKIKVGPPGPRAKRSFTKVGPPIGKPRTVPPKSHKVGPPIGKSKSVAPASTQSQRHHSNEDEDVDDDSLYPPAPPLQQHRLRPVHPILQTAALAKDSSFDREDAGALAVPKSHTPGKFVESGTGPQISKGDAVAWPLSGLTSPKASLSAKQGRAFDSSEGISAFTATVSRAPLTASSPIASGSLQTTQSSSPDSHPTGGAAVMSKDHATKRPRSSGHIPAVGSSAFRKYRAPGSDDEIDEIEYHSDSLLPTRTSSHGHLSPNANLSPERDEGVPLSIVNSNMLDKRDIETVQPDPTPYSPTRFKVDSPLPSTADADLSRLELQFPLSETPSQPIDPQDPSAKRTENPGAKTLQTLSVDTLSAEAADKLTTPGELECDPARTASPLQAHSHPSLRTRADDSGMVPETQETLTTDPVSLEPYVPQSSQPASSQPNMKIYTQSAPLTTGSTLGLPSPQQLAQTVASGPSPSTPANVSGVRMDELPPTQSDPAALIEITLLRRLLSDAEKAVKAKDEELINTRLDAARREREAVEAESNKYKGLLNEQKEMYNKAIRELKDRGTVKRKHVGANETRDDERWPESPEHIALHTATAQLCTFLSVLTTEVSSIQGHTSKVISSLSSIGNHMTTPANEAPPPSSSISEVLHALSALASSSSTLRELRISAFATEAETAVSRSISLVKSLEVPAAESASTYNALVRAHDIVNADVEYFRVKYQEVASKAAELGEENLNLASQNEIAMSTARNGVKQAELYFGEMEKSLQSQLAQTEARANLLAQRCERAAAKAHLIPVYQAEAARLYAGLELGDDDLEFPMVIDAALGKFRHLQWRWREDFAVAGDLLSIDAEEFDHVEDFAATMTEKIETLIRCCWADLGELGQIGIRVEDANELRSLVSEIIHRFKVMQDTIQRLRSELDPLTSGDAKPLRDTFTPTSQDPSPSNVARQYADIADDYHYRPHLGIMREQSAPVTGESRTAAPDHSLPSAHGVASDILLSTGDATGAVPHASVSSPETLDSDEETYPCPSRDRDDRPCATIFKAFEDVKQHVLAEHIYPDAIV